MFKKDKKMFIKWVNNVHKKLIHVQPNNDVQNSKIMFKLNELLNYYVQ
jgi:hypothetical protein